MPLDYYITKNGKRLRCGYTTGSCAVMAVKAALEMLFTGKTVSSVKTATPKGIDVSAEIYDAKFDENFASCAVVKDGGDDIDVTNGLKIFASVRKIENGVVIDGGEGVGRVTKKGLDRPVGCAAINSTPLRLIEEEALAVCKKYKYQKGIEIIISVPMGEEVAEKTFNSRLGIEGGISIIGTSGIVEPMSTDAVRDTVKTEMKMLSENGVANIIAAPGNYGQSFIDGIEDIKDINVVKFSNFLGDTLNFAAEYGFKKILLIGHIGKFVKVAGGIMNTHSNMADCRMEILAAHASLFAESGVCAEIMECVTTDDAVDLLIKHGIKDSVMESIAKKAEFYISKRIGNDVEGGIIMFSNKHGLLAMGEVGRRLLTEFGGKNG